MTSIIEELANGQLGNSEAAIFTATNPTVVKKINFGNTNTTTNRSLTIKRKKSGGTARLMHKATIPPEGSAIMEEDWTLGTGDEIRAFSDVAAEVDFTVSGYQFP